MAKNLREAVLEQAQTPVNIRSVESGVDISVINSELTRLFTHFPADYLDAFGRHRVSFPKTIFDSKQTLDNLPLFWDDQEVSGGGTSSTYDQDEATTDIAVGANTAGVRTRQTFRYFNYEPGKGQLILFTSSKLDTANGITKIVGYGNDDNGLFLVSQAGNIYFRRRTSVTGAAVDNDVIQTDWNVDKLDGNGASGITLDPSRVQIFFIDFEWLGVGSVRFGFVIDGEFVICHQMNNANNLTTVFMSTPNLPLRYSIENDGTGAADSFGHICSSVISEGGAESTGKTGYTSLQNIFVNANTAGTIYALAGLRLRTGYDATIQIERITVNSVAVNTEFEWLLILNPTIAGGLSWADIANYAVQRGLGDTASNPSTTTVTGGTILDGGYAVSDTVEQIDISNILNIGRDISGIPDEIVLCARAIAGNSDLRGSITFRELN